MRDCLLTDCDWLDLHTLLNMRRCRVVGVLVRKDFLAAEGVDEGRAACNGDG